MVGQNVPVAVLSQRLCLWFLLATLALLASPTLPVQAVADAPADTPSRFASDTLTGLLATDSYVFWHTGCGGEFYPSRSFLRRRVTDGSVFLIETRYFPETCAAGAVASFNVAADDTYVYWIEGNGRIVRQAVRGAATVEELARTIVPAVGGFPSCCSIGVDDTFVYWTEGTRILAAPKGGGGRRVIHTEAGGGIYDLRVGGDGTLFFRAFGRLYKLAPVAAAIYTATEVFGPNVAAYTFDANRVYYGYPLGAIYIVFSARRSDLGDRRIEHVSDAVSRPRLQAMAVDATNLYFYDRRGTTAGGPITRKPLAGGDIVQLTAYLTNVELLQVAGGKLFWTDFRTGIYSLPVGAFAVAAPDGDLIITGVHVTQNIQTDDHQVPLIGGKATAVRVFARSIEDSNGPWIDVVARIQFEGSETVLQSPPVRIPTGGSNRNTLDDSMLFILRDVHTAPGTRTATISISSLSGRPESSRHNNTLSHTFTFSERQYITFYGMPHGNANGYEDCAAFSRAPDGYIPPWSNFEAHRLYMENLFPVTQLTILQLPGNPRRLFDNNAPICNAYAPAHNWMAEEMARLFPRGGQYGYLLMPESNGYNGWCCTSNGGNGVARGQDYRDDPGPTMAHEIGHAYGRIHTFEDMNYVRDRPGAARPGSMGPYLGFRLLSNETPPRPQVIRGETSDDNFFGDVMSYHALFWISPYTYCLQAYTVSISAVACPSGLDGIPILTGQAVVASAQQVTEAPRQAAATTYLYVSGYLDEQGALTLLPFEQIDLEEAPVGPTGQSYRLELATANGPLPDGVFAFAIDPLEDLHPNNPQPQTQRHFGFYVPWNPATEMIQVFADQNPQPLATRPVTLSSPKIGEVIFDPGGPNSQPVEGVHKVEWSATDADQDPLTYSVWYSPDDGKEWLPVDVLQTALSTTVDFDALPGGSQARLRVLASDGMNTTLATTDLFSVPLHAPTVTASQSRDGDDYLLLATSSATDPEDGAIEDHDAYVWRSNWQGEVGRGPWLSEAALEPGEHLLTIEVKDSDGQVGNAVLEVMVRNRAESSGGVLLPNAASILSLEGLPAFQVEFPAGAVGEEVQVHLTDILSPTIVDTTPGVLGRIIAIEAQTDDGQPLTQFSLPFSLTATYDLAVLGATSPNQLTLASFDEINTQWLALPTTLDANQKMLMAQVDHLTLFAVIATQPEPEDMRQHLYLPALEVEKLEEQGM